MFGGPVVGAVVLGLETIGTAFRTHRANMEAAFKSSQDYRNSLMDVANTWSGMATGLIERNSFGKAMEREFQRSSDAAYKFQSEVEKQRFELRHGISFGEAFMQGLTGEKPGSLTNLFTTLHQGALETRMAGRAQYLRNEDYDKQISAQNEILNINRDILRIDQMRPGLHKEGELLNHKLLIEEKQRVEKQRAQTVEAAAAVEILQGEYDIAVKFKSANQDILNTKLQQAKIAQQQLPGQQDRENQEAQINKESAWAELRLKANLQLEAQAEKTEEAKIRATKRGYEQTAALHTKAFEYEETLAAGHGVRMLNLVKQMHADIFQEEARVNQENIQSAMAGVSSSTGRAAAGSVFQRQMADYKAMGASGEQLETLRRSLLTEKYIKQENVELVQLEYEKRNLTAEQADIKRMMAADNLSGMPTVRAEIEKLARLKEQTEAERDIRHYRTEGLQESIQLQLKRHEISRRDADVEQMILADRRAQGTGKEADQIRSAIVELANAKERMRMAEILHTGDFSTKFTAGRTNFAAYNQDRTYGSYMQAGGFTGQYGAYTNVGAVNRDQAQHLSSEKLLENIRSILERIAHQGGLN
jgi:hypothetical protein